MQAMLHSNEIKLQFIAIMNKTWERLAPYYSCKANNNNSLLSGPSE